MTSLNCNYFLKVSSPNTATVGIRNSIYEFGDEGDINIQSVVILQEVTRGIVLKLNLHNNHIIFTHTLSLSGEDWRPAEMGRHQIPPHSPLKPPLLSEEVTFELGPEGRERAKLGKNGGTGFQGEGAERAKGLGKTAGPI